MDKVWLTHRLTPLRLSAAFVALLGAGCDAYTAGSFNTFPTQIDPPVSALQTKYFSSDEDVQRGLVYFRSGNYGNAQRSFQMAVEKAPSDVAAWVGLAASYDRLRRFDLADRAYDEATRRGGLSLTVLNNRGYSYLLRGDVQRAREIFTAAYRIAPDHPTVINNLRLLDGSGSQISRLETAY